MYFILFQVNALKIKSLVNLDTKKRLQKLLDNLSCPINGSSLGLPEVPEVLKCKVRKEKKLAGAFACHLKSMLALSFTKKLNGFVLIAE